MLHMLTDCIFSWLLLGCFWSSNAVPLTDAASALSQLADEAPACALECISTELPKSICSATDLACICHNKALSDAIVQCLASSCTVVEQLQTKKAQDTVCGANVRNIGNTVIALDWIFFSTATIFVTCRLVARSPILGNTFHWDDYVIFACILAALTASVLAQLMVDNGLGRDIWMLTPHQINRVLFYFFVEEFLYVFVISFTKISILLLYLQIFTQGSSRYLYKFMMGYSFAYFVTGAIIIGTECRPISYMWEGWDGTRQATCIQINTETYVLGGFNMAADLVIVLLPIPEIYRLQMNTRKKMAVTAMFAVGIIVTICSIARLPTLIKFAKSSDPTYDYSTVAILSLIEMDAGIICACMPGMASLVRSVWPRVFGTSKADTRTDVDSYSLGGMPRSDAKSRNVRNKSKNSTLFTIGETVFDDRSAQSDDLELTPGHNGQEMNTRYSESTASIERGAYVGHKNM